MFVRTVPPVVAPTPAAPAVKNFETVYCERHGCSPARFRRQVFWATLHWHALPVAPFLLVSDYFAPDRDLIAACGRARSMAEIREELDEYRYHPLNSGWLRKKLALRISTHRLRRLAYQHLPGARLPLSFPAPS